ncbi:MAG: hypothetical protein K9J13_16190 [Saprospiraceae bacterium]|nr:hypothetical protein [Saprospiraceae bacterium]
MRYNIFGSTNSLDYDIMVYVDKIPCKQECKEMCLNFEQQLSKELADKEVDVNLAVVQDDVIVNVYKGTADECNNAVALTYYYHRQEWECPILRNVKRNVKLKLARALRSMLSFLSRTDYRSKVKSALKGTTEEKLAVLEEIDFGTITDIRKNNQNVIDFRKQAAFQIGQCLGLLQKIELYTKSGIVEYYPDLEPYLFRKKCDGSNLESHKKCLINWIRQDYPDVEEVKE